MTKGSGRVEVMATDWNETSWVDAGLHAETPCRGIASLPPPPLMARGRGRYRLPMRKLEYVISPERLDLMRQSKVLWRTVVGAYRLHDFETLPIESKME